MDKISVIVPVYKVEEYLEKCVDSLLNQTYQNYEIILVDDGSPDMCPQICDDYSRIYKNIITIHKMNGGLSDARNTGIEWVLRNSDSRWISFVDSDDWVHPQYLDLLLSAAYKYESKMVFAKFNYTTIRDCQYKEICDKICSSKVINVYSNQEFDPNSVCGRLFQKELWSELRFPVGKLHEDRFTTYKLLFQQNEIAVVDSPVYYYYMNIEGICRSKWNYGKLDNIQAAEEQIEYFSEHGFWDAWKITQCQYTKLLINTMCEVKKNYPKDKKTYRILQKKLRIQIKANGKKLEYNLKSNFNFYKYAWPIPAKIWRRIYSIKKI